MRARKRGRERVNTLVGTCSLLWRCSSSSSTNVQCAIRKQCPFTWLTSQLGAALLSSTVFSSAWNKQHLLYMPSSWHSPVDSWLQIRTSLLLYVIDILATCPWLCDRDRRLFATCGLWCQRDRVLLSPHPVQQSEQRGSVTRLSARLEVCRYFRVTAAARPVLSGPCRRKQCHMRLKLLRCFCCPQSKQRMSC